MAVRLDKWLWAARFFKTRKLSTEAIQGGHVHVNGVRGKPARQVSIGDELAITRGIYTYKIEVIELSDKRGSASIAQKLYKETEDSIKQRETIQLQRKNQLILAPKKRPDKRERAKIIRFKNKYSS